MLRTSASHIAPAGADPTASTQNRRAGFQTRPAGNAVNLEDEMLKTSANQMDYAAVTSLYSKSLHLLKTAIGKALRPRQIRRRNQGGHHGKTMRMISSARWASRPRACARRPGGCG